ncbi:MAG: lipopolysaccharide export system protein LptA [Bacteroidia bacterium]|jgi:lipopolysaccharide export system protein LptA
MKAPETLYQKASAALLAALVLVATQTFAAQAPINISADRASYEGGTGIYEGRVELIQGTLSIKAERLIIDEQNREVNRILASGKPSVLTQNDGSVRAQANSIEYFVKNGQIILTEQAVIQQRGSEIRGTRIVYDSEKQTVLAGSDEGGKSERVNMTLQPQKKPVPAEQATEQTPGQTPDQTN